MPAHINNAFVCLMGMGTVFVGLIVIVIICEILGAFFRVPAMAHHGEYGSAIFHGENGSAIFHGEHGPAAAVSSPGVSHALSAESGSGISAAPNEEAIPDRQQLIAAVSAAIAEDLGTDVTGIQVLSFKKL